MRVGVELLEDAAQQARPGRTSVMCPQHAAYHLAAEPHTAAFVGNWKTPAAHAMTAPRKHRPGHGARADDDDPAILTAMCSNARGMGVRRENRPPKWMLVPSGRGEIDRLARARQCKAGNDVVIIE